MSAADLIECSTCRRMFADTDGTRVCPAGHENPWADDEATYADRLRGMVW